MKLRSKLLFVGIVAVCLGAMYTSSVFGQGAPAPAPAATPAVARPAAPAAAPAADSGKFGQESGLTLWGLWTVGGWCMWPLGLTNIAAVAFTIYGYMLVRENKMLVPQLVPSLQTSLDGLRLDEAINACAGTPSTTTNILHAGLQRISDGMLDVGSMEKAMEEAAIEETQAGLRMINYISITAQISPMLGLLGTVSGMIKAFEKIGRGAMGKPELLANDIGEALITTAYGLIIGIPAMCFFFYLKSRYTANVTKMGRILGNLTHHLVTASRRAESGQLPVVPSEPAAGSAS